MSETRHQAAIRRAREAFEQRMKPDPRTRVQRGHITVWLVDGMIVMARAALHDRVRGQVLRWRAEPD